MKEYSQMSKQKSSYSRDSNESRYKPDESTLYVAEVGSRKRNYANMTGPSFVPPSSSSKRSYSSSSYSEGPNYSSYSYSTTSIESSSYSTSYSTSSSSSYPSTSYHSSSSSTYPTTSTLNSASSSTKPTSEQSSSNAPTSSSRASLFRKEEHEEGKTLSKNQIRNSIRDTDQSHSTFHNEHLPDDKIATFVSDILYRFGNVDPLMAKQLMDAEGIKIFRTAFTHWTVTFTNKSELNFEVYETLGDVTFNKVIMFYLMRRFPELMTDPEANYKLTEAQKLYKSRLLGYKFADELNLPSMVRWRNFKYGNNPQKIIEMDNKFKTDVFESFLGAVELLIDTKVFPHAGYSVAYHILDTLLKDVDMTVDVALTKPPTGKLKELMDRLHGVRIYLPQKDDTNDIIGMNVRLKFDKGIQTKSLGVLYEHILESGYIRGKEQGEDCISKIALAWLDQECDKRW